MKILITTDLFTMGKPGEINANGVITSVKNLYTELTKIGHEVKILTLSRDRKTYKEGDVYYMGSLPFPVYPHVRASYISHKKRKYINEILEWKPDVIHSQCEFFTMPFANKISKKTSAPIVHTYHTVYEHYVGYIGMGKKIGKALVRHYSKRFLRHAKAVIAPTVKVKDILEGYGMKQPIHVIPTGINLDQHKQRITQSDRLEMRRALGIGDNDFVSVFVGRLGKEKNVEELLEYFSKASEGLDNAKLLVVGGGPDADHLKAYAAKLQTNGSIIFSGMVPPERVHEYYQLGDLFLCASTSEAQGLTYVEAAANSLPLLCREDGCLALMIKQGENGYSYADLDTFKEKLTYIYGNEEWRKKASAISYDIAMGFDNSTFAANAAALYASLIS